MALVAEIFDGIIYLYSLENITVINALATQGTMVWSKKLFYSWL